MYAWKPSYDLPTPVSSGIQHDGESTRKRSLFDAITGWLMRPAEKRQSPLPSPLCQPCQRIFTGQRPDSELGGPHRHSLGLTFSQMQQFAIQGCSLCHIRLSQLKESQVSQLLRDCDIKYGYWESRVGNGIAFEYAHRTPGADPVTHSIALVPAQDHGQTSRFSQLRTVEAQAEGDNAALVHTASNVNRPSSIEIIRYWIRDCVENHAKCAMNPLPTPRLPARLIDIGTGDMIQPMLCSTEDLPLSTLYVTLSHCRGTKGQDFLRLLDADEESLKRRIPVERLSKTFRDAMEITSRLGFRYIWIDSLCIIQDAQSDWKEQAALMGDFYRSAHCNLAATAAEDGTDGLFFPRTLLDVEPCRVEPSWRGHRRQAYYCHGIGTWEWEVEQQPLLCRAWVAQEVTLATRVVHFSRSEILWECLEKRASETYPDGIPNFTAEKLSLRPRQKSEMQWFEVQDGNFPFHAVWKDAVKLYSACDLTYKTKDKLIAISGIARSLPLPSEDYLAGLWRQGISEQLLWTVYKSDNGVFAKPVRSPEYRAPSWSWASIDGAVLMRTPTLSALNHMCIDILGSGTTPTDPTDRYGQISNGFVHLRGMLAYAQLSERIKVMTTRTKFVGGQITEVPLDPDDSRKTIIQRFLGDVHVNICLDTEEPIAGEFYHCLVFSLQFGGCGLVIQPTGAYPGEYTRRGYFAVLKALYPNSPEKFVELCRDFGAATQDSEMLYKSKANLTREGVQRYVINLV